MTDYPQHVFRKGGILLDENEETMPITLGQLSTIVLHTDYQLLLSVCRISVEDSPHSKSYVSTIHALSSKRACGRRPTVIRSKIIVAN